MDRARYLLSSLLLLLFTAAQPGKLLVINSTKAYRQNVKADDGKRMVSLRSFGIEFIPDFKYATADNFTHTILYADKPDAYLRNVPAKALKNACDALKKRGLGIKVFDAYRPYQATVKMWEVVPDERYAANPAKGSGHNRGAAIDLTLVDLKTGKELAMPTEFDNFTEKAHHDYMQLSEEIKANRKLLRETMEQAGFVALETEWWHYSWPDAAKLYPLMDLDFKTMRSLAK